MKILIVNYRYFVSGGPERYMFNIISKLEKEGHEVSVFSVHSNRNEKTCYDRYFVEPIGGRDAVYFDECKKNLKTIIKLISRSCYSFEVKNAIQREIKDVRPDVVYIIHFVNKLSPSVITGAKDLGVPVVLRLSDYFLLCPRFDFLCNGAVCEDCLSKGYLTCIKHRCVKNSLAASAVRVLSMKLHRMLGIYNHVDAFITPTAFMKDKLVQYGFSAEKIHHIPTFTSWNTGDGICDAGTYGLYFGRITEEKDVGTIIRAYEILKDKKLKIVGDDTTGEAIRLKQYLKEHNLKNIEFTGVKSGKELHEVIQNARFCIISSIWYENLPNTIIESFSFSKPVLASNIGCLPEIICDGHNGFLFKVQDPVDLSEKIKLFDDEELVKKLGKNGRKSLNEIYSSDVHYQKLMSVFYEVSKQV